jgi:xanthosine utilization system XapX-like protein
VRSNYSGISFQLIYGVSCKMVFNALPGISQTPKVHVLGLLGAMVGLQVYGVLNILLERLSLALVYWSLMGVLTTLISLPEASLEAG